MKSMRTWLLALLIVAMIVLHQDLWFWTDKYLVLGFLPVGLAYHAGYSVLCSLTLAVLVWTAWPKHLEDVQPAQPESVERREGGH